MTIQRKIIGIKSNDSQIRRIVKYICKKLDTAHSTGLYNGKAGIALSLFEAAKYLQDDQLEDQAFNLLQEALLSVNDNCDFENGLAGIGYVLCYLIENRFIDADFKELFGRQYEKIINNVSRTDTSLSELLKSIQTIHFLSIVNRIADHNPRIEMVIQKMYEGLELYLSIQFSDFANSYYTQHKFLILSKFKQYLRLVESSCYNNYSLSLMGYYDELYNKGRVASDFITEQLLENVIMKHDSTNYSNIANNHKRDSLKNLHADSLYMHERIELLSSMHSDFMLDHTIDINILERSMFNINRNKIQSIIPPYTLDIGYGFGLSRLLVYMVNKQHCLV